MRRTLLIPFETIKRRIASSFGHLKRPAVLDDTLIPSRLRIVPLHLHQNPSASLIRFIISNGIMWLVMGGIGLISVDEESFAQERRGGGGEDAGESRWVAAGVEERALPKALERQWVVLAQWGDVASELRLSWAVERGRVIAVEATPLDARALRGEPVVEVAPLQEGAVLVRVGWRKGRKGVQWSQGAGWRLDEQTFDPYEKFRHGARFVSSELGLSWRCDPLAVRLCRKVLMPLSYPELGGRLSVRLWSGVADEAQALREFGALARAQGASARAVKKLKSKRGVVELGFKVSVAGQGKVQRWLQGRKVGERWVLCQLEHKPKGQVKLKQARALCASLQEAPGFEGRLDCEATPDACARACEGGQGWACEALGDEARLVKGCALGWAPACLRWGQGAGGQAALERACALGSERGCAQASRQWPWEKARDVLVKGCQAQQGRACDELATRCKGQPSCEPGRLRLWARRACALGAIGWCALE